MKRTLEDKRNANSNLYTENSPIAECTNFENYQRFIKNKENKKNVNITLLSIYLKTKRELSPTN